MPCLGHFYKIIKEVKFGKNAVQVYKNDKFLSYKVIKCKFLNATF